MVVDDEADEVMNEDAETEKEQMSELQRFYVEKFEGNVLREFYPEGALKSEAEVKEGKRHGRYREYYEMCIRDSFFILLKVCILAPWRYSNMYFIFVLSVSNPKV